MLVLSRKISEKIILQTSDGEIVLMVIGIDRGQVKLGLDAPKSVNICRSELLGIR